MKRGLIALRVMKKNQNKFAFVMVLTVSISQALIYQIIMESYKIIFIRDIKFQKFIFLSNVVLIHNIHLYTQIEYLCVYQDHF